MVDCQQTLRIFARSSKPKKRAREKTKTSFLRRGSKVEKSNNASLNLCGLRRENENKEDFFFHLLPRAFASLRSLAHPRDKPENPRGLPIRKSRGYSSPYSNRSVNCSFWSHKGRTGRKAVIFAHTDIAQRNVQRNTYKEKKDPSNAVLKTANNLDILYAI